MIKGNYTTSFVPFLLGMIFLLVGCGTDTSIEVEGDEFEFTPSEVTIPAGEEITLTFTNTGREVHNLIVDDLDIAVEAEPGERETITFVANEAGTFEMYCDIDGHDEMRGTLIVVEE
ncbi:MAG: cupredoxin domain-containing protein [Bacillus sp. (in: Bacteria)]|nr:cupredoxin domain-containing protein [Bacillus sp. (in: firmicutes)]